MSGPGESSGAQALASRTPAGQIRVGDRVLSFSQDVAAIVLPAPGRRAVVRRRGPRESPVFFPPVLGREEELASASAALEAMLPVQFVGAPGAGRTSLLAHLAAGTKAPDGVIWLSARMIPLSDLQQGIFDVMCEVEVPLKPNGEEMHEFLKRLEALIVLDDVRLPPEDVQALVDSTPHCPTVLASDEELLWGEGRTVFIPPLPEGPALELLERELGRALRPDERVHAAALADALDGRPLLLAQAGALLREEGLSFREAVELVGSAAPTEALGAAIAQALTERERRVLGVLASLEGVSVHPDLVEAVTGLSDPVSSLRLLVRRGVAHVVGDRYSIAHSPADSLRRAVEAAWWADQMLEYLAGWAEEHQLDHRLVRGESEALLWAIDRAEARARWPEALRLARAAEAAVALGGLWGAWERLLVGGLEAARELTDQDAEGWFLHQLGTRALCLGDVPSAELSLVAALDIQQGLPDVAQARATRHNLDLSIEDEILTVGVVSEAEGTRAERRYRRPSLWAIARLLLVVLAVGIPVGAFLVRNVPHPGLQVNPTSLSFNTVSIGQSAKQSITLTNQGPKDTSVTEYYFVTSAADFSIDQGTCGVPLSPTKSCTISVIFAPTTIGEVSTTLQLFETATGKDKVPKIRILGTGKPGAVVSLDPPRALDFGELPVGGTARKRVTVSNAGDEPLTITVVATIPLLPDFVSVNGCKAPLDPSASCSISITFHPTTTGKRTTTLSITDNAAGFHQTVKLTGVGTAPSKGVAVGVSPSSIGFGGVSVGIVSGIRQVTITNSGPGLLTISGTPIGGPAFSDFESTTTCPFTRSMAVGKTCVITVRFDPTRDGQRLATLSILDNGVGNPHSVPLSGTGILPVKTPGISFSPLTLDFGDIPLLQPSSSQTTTIKNTGQAALGISSIQISSPFAGSHDCPKSLNPGKGCTVTVSFTPTVLGEATATIKFTDALGVQSVSLSGNGIKDGAPSVQLSSTSLDFGDVPVDSIVGASVTVTNSGNATLNINSVSSGASLEFLVDPASQCAGTLDPGQSCVVIVDFHPLAIGTFTGQLTIVDDAAGSSQTVSLTGNGGTLPTP